MNARNYVENLKRRPGSIFCTHIRRQARYSSKIMLLFIELSIPVDVFIKIESLLYCGQFEVRN